MIDYTYEYDRRYHPAMPAVSLWLGPALDEPAFEIEAIIDSGADATSVPIETLKQIGANRSRRAWMRGTTGDRLLVDLYTVGVRLGPFRQGLLEVIGDNVNAEVVVGRDILNHLVMTLNGLAGTVVVSAE